MPAGAEWFELAPAQAMHLHADFVVMEVGIEQRHIEVLAATSTSAVKQGRANSQGCVSPGTDIADRRLWDVGRSVSLAAH